MPKEAVDLENVKKYKNGESQILEAHKESQKKVYETSLRHNKDKFDKYGEDLYKKNTYFNNSKIPDKNSTDIINSELSAINSLRKIGPQSTEDYCQKCPALKNRCIHKVQKENLKDKYTYPITTSSTYGWLEPYDNLDNKDYKLKSEIKEFYDKSHL